MPPLNPPSEMTVAEVLKACGMSGDFVIENPYDPNAMKDNSGFKPGELQVFKASRQTGKSLIAIDKALDGLPLIPIDNALDELPFDEWREQLKDGLTSEEQGPCT